MILLEEASTTLSMDTIAQGIEFVVMIISFLLGRYVLPKIKEDDIAKAMNKLNIIVSYADKFVAWAKEFKQDETGQEKMETVVSKLKDIADKHNIEVDEDELKAIAQKAYNEMISTSEATKKKESENKTE